MKIKALLFSISLGALLFTGCKKDEPSLGDAPTTADAQFTYEKTAANPNIVVFTAKNTSLVAKWDFGNGTTGEGTSATAEYPSKGTYTVKLTVFNSGGSASSTQEITIDEDDPTLMNNPLYTLLTGGSAGKGYKTWVIDSTREAHFGVGPSPTHPNYDGTDFPTWWKASPLDKAGSGLYNDNYVFHLEGFKFDMNTGGDVYLNDDQAGNFSGSFESPVGDYTAPYEDRKGLTWTLTEGEDTTLTISGDGFIGFYTGVRTYKIVSISENELFLQYLDAGTNADAPDLAWYIRLVPDDLGIDTTGGGGNNDPKFTLPMDFESVEPTWEAFGGSTYQYIDNPDASGINTSSRVLETVHGNETWAGLFVNVDNKFDFTSKQTIKIKLWAPATGTMRLKLENSSATTQFVEKDVTVDQANTWIELTWDFSDQTSTEFDRLVIFPGWDIANAGTFYVDDIVQE